jgi:polyisoprenoid-binding protein YceI
MLLIATVATLAASLTAATPAFQAPAAPAASAQAPSGARSFTVDAVHSKALFRVMHMGAGQFWGRFNDVSGTFSFDPSNLATAKFDITIAIESVDSGNGDLDKHLRSPDFFAAKDFPTMTFRSTGLEGASATGGMLKGDLTMTGVTKPVTAKLEFTGMSDMGRGMKSGFEATFTIKRSDFGITYGVDKGAIGDEVRVTVALEGNLAK